MTQYKGHIPGSGIQQHSAGELFPVYIEKVGDLWYAVHPEKRWRSIGVSTHASAEVISSIFLDRATSGVDHPQGRQRYEAELKARQNYVPAPQPEESSPAETPSTTTTGRSAEPRIRWRKYWITAPSGSSRYRSLDGAVVYAPADLPSGPGAVVQVIRETPGQYATTFDVPTVLLARWHPYEPEGHRYCYCQRARPV